MDLSACFIACLGHLLIYFFFNWSNTWSDNKVWTKETEKRDRMRMLLPLTMPGLFSAWQTWPDMTQSQSSTLPSFLEDPWSLYDVIRIVFFFSASTSHFYPNRKSTHFALQFAPASCASPHWWSTGNWKVLGLKLNHSQHVANIIVTLIQKTASPS